MTCTGSIVNILLLGSAMRLSITQSAEASAHVLLAGIDFSNSHGSFVGQKTRAGVEVARVQELANAIPTEAIKLRTVFDIFNPAPVRLPAQST